MFSNNSPACHVISPSPVYSTASHFKAYIQFSLHICPLRNRQAVTTFALLELINPGVCVSSYPQVIIESQMVILIWMPFSATYSRFLTRPNIPDRIPGWARFSIHFQTWPGLQRGSSTMDTVSFPGVKRRWHGVDHLRAPSTEVKDIRRSYIYSPYVPSWHVIGWVFKVLHT